jgi:hypothetical protein
MKTSRATYSLLIVLLFLAAFLFIRRHEPRQREAFDRHPAHLYYTKHALCRMDCRHIGEAEIMEIMNKGIINFNKSSRNGAPCPTFALQGETSGGLYLFVVFAQCREETKVVTCYNLREKFECHCPGDENKN